jgi:exodeoxyribonuclease VII large subunit
VPSKKPPDQTDLFSQPPKYFDEVPLPGDEEAPPAPVQKPAPAAPAKPEIRVYSVRELVHAAGRTVEARFGLVWVEGEVSNVSVPRSGHFYFTLKDAESQLGAVLFRATAQRLPLKPRDGLKIRARGRLSVYDGQGKLQLLVEALEPAGLGAAQMAFALLKEKLGAEGLFEASRKRALPRWPRRIGVATSATGAAIRDIIRVAESRGRARILLAACQVQGDNAPQEISGAIDRLSRVPDVDVIIVGRGGGSAEDLAAFNDERLARVISGCRVPVVSAVGHEVDFTICDFVADARAPTPSAAAEMTVPLYADAQARLDEARRRVARAGARAVAEARQRLDGGLERARVALAQMIARRRRLLDGDSQRLLGQHPRARLHRDRGQLEALSARLANLGRTAVVERRARLGALAGKLGALSPLAVLDRGYSLTRDAAGHVVSDAARLSAGDQISVTLARGSAECRVVATQLAADPPPGDAGDP